jgi:hypothetical protein
MTDTDSITKTCFEQISEILKDYLGPAAPRFISRQISNHFGKDPESLQKSDIPILAIRIRSGLMVLTRDEVVVEEAFHRVSSLAD